MLEELNLSWKDQHMTYINYGIGWSEIDMTVKLVAPLMRQDGFQSELMQTFSKLMELALIKYNL